MSEPNNPCPCCNEQVNSRNHVHLAAEAIVMLTAKINARRAQHE